MEIILRVAVIYDFHGNLPVLNAALLSTSGDHTALQVEPFAFNNAINSPPEADAPAMLSN